MPTQLPTQTVCLNCNHEVKTENKYCPNCGQENADKRISLALLLKDAIATAFNFESRVFKTIPLFLFYPGRLTNEFLEGKRVSYMHPFKIYLLSSLLFFFVAIKLFTPTLEDSIRKLHKDSEELNSELSFDDSVKNEKSFVEKDSIYYDSISDELVENFQQRQTILKDSISEMIENIKLGRTDQENSIQTNLDSLQSFLEDTISTQVIDNSNKKAMKQANGLRKFLTWIQDRNMTPEILLDSLEGESSNKKESAMRINTATQLLKIGRNDYAIFLANIINNIGTFMFFTLPLLALFFIPFYIRKNKYYIDHLIFTLHLQAFTFIILTVAALFYHWTLWGVSLIVFLGLIVYVWFAFKNVYKQGSLKTTIKSCVISLLYLMTLFFMISLNLLYSFYTF